MGYLGLCLSKRNYLLLWCAHIVSEAGNWLTFIAITVLAYQITGSGLAVSGVFIARAIPTLFLAPIAGVIVDRWNRKAILVISDVARGTLVLTLLIIHDLSFVYVVVGLTAIADLFFQPARSALIPNLVEERNLIAANALLAFGSDALSIIGPALAGAIVTRMGIRGAFILDAISFWLSAIMIAAMSVLSMQSKGVSFRIKQEWAEALSFIRIHRSILLLVMISALVMLGGGALNVLLIVFANEHLGVGDNGFAWLVSALGVGFVAGSLLMGIVGKRLSQRSWLSSSLLALGLVPIVWSLSYNNFPLALGVAVVNGIANSVFNIVIEAFLQTYVPDEVLGKVLSLSNQLMTITSLISMSVAGWLSDIIGVRAVFIIAGFCILSTFILSQKFEVQPAIK